MTSPRRRCTASTWGCAAGRRARRGARAKSDRSGGSSGEAAPVRRPPRVRWRSARARTPRADVDGIARCAMSSPVVAPAESEARTAPRRGARAADVTAPRRCLTNDATFTAKAVLTPNAAIGPPAMDARTTWVATATLRSALLAATSSSARCGYARVMSDRRQGDLSSPGQHRLEAISLSGHRPAGRGPSRRRGRSCSAAAWARHCRSAALWHRTGREMGGL